MCPLERTEAINEAGLHIKVRSATQNPATGSRTRVSVPELLQNTQDEASRRPVLAKASSPRSKRLWKGLVCKTFAKAAKNAVAGKGRNVTEVA